MAFYQDKASQLLVCFDGDVVVLGGGTAGVLAAVAAARQGAKTLLIERMNALGGNMTTNLNTANSSGYALADGRRILGGLAYELMERIHKLGGIPGVDDIEDKLYGSGKADYTFFSHVAARLALADLCREAGVDVLLHTHFSHVLDVQDGVIDGIAVVNKAGRFAVLGKAFIDASGDADLAYAAGAPCVNIIEDWHNWQDKTISPELLNEHTRPDRSIADYFFTTKMEEQLGGKLPGRFNGGFPWGLNAVITNVDADKNVAAFAKTKPWEKLDIEDWLEKVIGHSPTGRMHNDRLKHPIRCFNIVDEEHGVYPVFTPEVMEIYLEKYRETGYLRMPLMHWREKLIEAVDAGDLELFRVFPGKGVVQINLDGYHSVPGMGKGTVMINCGHATFDLCDPYAISMAEIETQRFIHQVVEFLRKYVPGFENAVITQFGQQIVPRADRMIDGEKNASSLSCEILTTPDDTIALNGTFDLNKAVAEPYRIPYGMLVPKKLDNLLVAGKCASGALAIRSQPMCFAMGEAAGIAAAQMVQTNRSNRAIDMQEYHDRLLKQGVIV